MRTTLVVTIAILLIHDITIAQYLRDNIQIEIPAGFYPENDLTIFNHYSDQETFPISLHPVFGIPEIEVAFEDTTSKLFFDFGNNSNIIITPSIKELLKYSIIDSGFTYTPEGKERGKVYTIKLFEFDVFGQKHINETATLADWEIFSTEPFNGLIGLNYLNDKCFTISYRQKLLAISDVSIRSNLNIPY